MRHTKECGFPYQMKTVCYIEIGVSGVSSPKGVMDIRESIRRCQTVGSGSKLYAVWPGNWSSDLFEVDLDEAAAAFDVTVKRI